MKTIKENNAFFRIISPPTLAIVAVLDLAVVYFAFFAVKKLIAFTTKYAIFFAIMELFAIVISVLVTKNIIAQGIIFNDDFMEFTAFDENNTVRYDEIEAVETKRDSKASLIKNFNDRHSFLIFKMKDESTIMVDIGLTTAQTLAKACDEITKHIK